MRRSVPRLPFAIAAVVVLGVTAFASCASGTDDGRSAAGSSSSSTSSARANGVVTTGDPTSGTTVVVTKITDGDTIRVEGIGPVRFIGIDTPEKKTNVTELQCFGPEASAHLASLIPVGSEVRLEYDVERTDRYDRTLAYVYRASDNLFLNAAQIRDGFAQAYTVPPDVAHAEEFVALQREARDADRGLWGSCPAGSLTSRPGGAQPAG